MHPRVMQGLLEELKMRLDTFVEMPMSEETRIQIQELWTRYRLDTI